MTVYYIITGFDVAKQYYSEHNQDSTGNGSDPVIFTPSLRNAMNFATIEEAKTVINNHNLNDCVIIDPYGRKQD